MNRHFPFAFLSLLMLSMAATAQWPADRHQPYDACSPTTPQNATSATRLRIHPADDIKLVPTMEIPAKEQAELTLYAWRGERCSTQILIAANGAANQLTVSCTILQNGKHAIQPSISMVRYTRAHGTATADIIGNETSCDNPASVPRAAWLQVEVPQNAVPGVYEGFVDVTAENGLAVRQKITLTVAPEMLPAPAQWKMHLDLWQHPQAVARWHDVEPWSEEHFALLRPLMKRLAEAGQKCITCTVLDEAWNGQTYDSFPGMVRWVRGTDGIMRYDYSELDKWVSFMHDEIGIRGQISCYTMIPWHLSVRFFDESTGHYDQIKAVPGTPEYEKLWAPFLRDFHRHMAEKGWAEKTCIAIDERPDKYVRAAMALVRENASSFRVASAVDKPSELTREVYNISPVLTHAGTALGDLLRERHEAGKVTTFYVCLHPLKPNTFTHSAPAEAEWLGFFAATNLLDGFLRWAYNSWNRNPFECTDFVQWPSGDCFLVYPGNRTSIRFERLRDGIENYEKIRILREKAAESPEAAEIVAGMDAQLAEIFTVERSKGTGHAADVQRARRIIEKTAEKLRAPQP